MICLIIKILLSNLSVLPKPAPAGILIELVISADYFWGIGIYKTSGGGGG